MDRVRLVQNKILSTAETFLSFLEQQIDYTTLEKLLKKELDDLGCDLIRELLEALDQKIYQGKAGSFCGMWYGKMIGKLS